MVITVSPSWTFFLQQVFVLVGALGTIVIQYRLSRAKNSSLSEHLAEVSPHVVTAIILTATLLYAIELFFY
jgi:methionine synthase I (cobalamin-dependent)